MYKVVISAISTLNTVNVEIKIYHIKKGFPSLNNFLQQVIFATGCHLFI